MQSKATSVKEYLAQLPADRRAAIAAVRQIVLANLDSGYEEGMQYGMIGYYVPHRVYPPGYHCDPKQPLPFAALASQKNYMSLYLMSVYGDNEQKRFEQAWAKTGKKLNMGKCCVRFKKVEDLALDVIAKHLKSMPASKHIAQYESAIDPARKRSTRPAGQSTGKSRSKQAAKSSRTAKGSKSPKQVRSKSRPAR